MSKLSLIKINRTRDASKLVSKTFRLNSEVASAFVKQAQDEGCKQVYLVEKAIVFYLNNGGTDAKIG